jgi:hypothetical protein
MCCSVGGRLLGALFVFLFFLAIPGCGSETAAGFNNTIADLHTKLAAAEKKVEDTMEWPPDDPAKKRAANDQFRTTVEEARKRFDALQVPPGDAARRFHAGFNDYLKTQEEAVPLYKQYLDPSRKLTGEEEARNRDALGKMKEKRAPLAQQLAGLQQMFVREAGLQLAK